MNFTILLYPDRHVKPDWFFPDAPEIENEAAYIHTSEGDNIEVICIVHSSPRAEVTWYKDGQVLEPTSHVIDHRGNRHTLTIPNVDQNLFGTYSCKAQNQYGEDKKTTVVTGMDQQLLKFTFNTNSWQAEGCPGLAPG